MLFLCHLSSGVSDEGLTQNRQMRPGPGGGMGRRKNGHQRFPYMAIPRGRRESQAPECREFPGAHGLGGVSAQRAQAAAPADSGISEYIKKRLGSLLFDTTVALMNRIY